LLKQASAQVCTFHPPFSGLSDMASYQQVENHRPKHVASLYIILGLGEGRWDSCVISDFGYRLCEWPTLILFYLGLLPRFASILTACRPKLDRVFQEWRKQELPEDLFSVLTLTGLGLEDPLKQPVRWDVWFETTDDDWLGITIPFVGDSPRDAVVDT
jgi:hypothetical protein